MENYGYIRVAAAMPEVHVADTEANAKEAISLVNTIWKEKEASIIVFPELSVTGYTCADLFGRPGLSERAEDAVASIVAQTAGLPVLLALGAPVPYAGRLFNCAIIARGGKILGIVPKTYLPGNDEFYEPRWFESARILGKELIMMDYASQRVPFGTAQLFVLGGIELGVELCQDLWVPVPPCTAAALAGAKIILNLSASNEVLMKQQYRRQLVGTTAAKLHAGYVYCSSGYGESTQDLVWTGSSMIYESGTRLAENERFQTSSCYIAADIDTERLTSGRLKDASYRCEEMMIPHYQRVDAGSLPVHRFKGGLMHHVEPHPFVPDIAAEDFDRRCREIIDIQVAGLRTRLDHIGCRSAVIGVSGGLDSTLALLVTALAFDSLGLPRTGITGITMPGLGTTRRTHDNSLELMRLLGISSSEIDICAATRQHFADIGQDESVHDVTYENSQARERTQILMDMANKLGGIVIGTGDLSELALGWCTYNGDHMSMYAVNSSIPKTLVRTLVIWASCNRFGDEVRDVLLDIADTPISPELTPADSEGRIAQKTEDLVGPYELHDFFLFNCLRYGFGKEKILFLAKQAFSGTYSDETIERWLDVFMRRFVRQQFKRSCLPDGPKVGSVALSPRGDWRMPTDLEVDQF
ncbi:MAG: NAD(+) synthase [Bacteroidales bacterium]|nr:NAD(+) synthase [Bacteroidales bacterium]